MLSSTELVSYVVYTGGYRTVRIIREKDYPKIWMGKTWNSSAAMKFD
jgi:hypothetical protein